VLITIAVQNPGLVMALKIVPIRPMAVTSPVMTAMVVTVVLTVVTMVVVMYMDVLIRMHVTMILTQPWMMIAAQS
jgi:hypothetical protein